MPRLILIIDVRFLLIGAKNPGRAWLAGPATVTEPVEPAQHLVNSPKVVEAYNQKCFNRPHVSPFTNHRHRCRRGNPIGP